MGVWVYGDGQGELMNFRLLGLASADTELDHYVTIDFTGWRYFELVEPEGERFEDYSWPYGRSLYKTYREVMAYGNVLGLSLWYNNVPVGRTVTCYLSPIKAVLLVQQKLVSPSITLNGRTVTFPVAIESGQYLELRGPEDCRLFSVTGEPLCEVRPEGEIPTLEPGSSEVAFHAAASDCRPRATVTVISEADRAVRR
jgi:hypothetical protein